MVNITDFRIMAYRQRQRLVEDFGGEPCTAVGYNGLIKKGT